MNNVLQLHPDALVDEDLVLAVDLAVAAGISYRQVDFWTRAGILTPATDASPGSGYRRAYTRDQLAKAALMKRLLDAGMTVQGAHTAAADLLTTGATRIAGMTLHLPEQE